MKNIVKTSLFLFVLFVQTMLSARTPLYREKAEIPVRKENFHLYLLAGQSNMAGRGIVEPQDTIANPRILRLNKEGEWEIAKDPLHYDKANAGVGPGLSFAREILVGENKDIVIGLIPCAVGGSGIDVWKKGAFYDSNVQSYPYDEAIRRTRLAMQNGVLKGILWHQGESDSEPEKAAVYKEKLIQMVKNLRNEFQTPDIPFIAGEIPPFRNRGVYINEVFHKAKNDILNYDVVSAQRLTLLADSIHLDAASQRELGKRYAEKMKEKQFVSPSKKAADWEYSLYHSLPLMGHRNWILIVDKAFPAQTSPGMEILNTDGDILEVSKLVLAQLNASTHVKPIVYLDKEFNYLTPAQIPQIEDFRNKYKELFKAYPVQTLLHESVFSKLDEASKLFKIIVLKTNCLIPYSSVFIELDCKYWNEKAEQDLRKSMKNK